MYLYISAEHSLSRWPVLSELLGPIILIGAKLARGLGLLVCALFAGFLLLSLLLASYLVGISLVLMTSVKFSLLLSPQHSLSGIADGI